MDSLSRLGKAVFLFGKKEFLGVYVYTKEKTQLPFKGEYIIIMLQMAFVCRLKSRPTVPFAADELPEKQGKALFVFVIFVEIFIGDAIICSFPDH